MTERTCHHCRFSIGHPFGGLVCQLTEEMATEACEEWEREPGSEGSKRYKTGRLYVGQRIGMLQIIAEAGKDKTGRRMLRARCDCGNERVSWETNLKRRTQGVKSCGCAKVKHGMWRHPSFEVWTGMMKRCYNAAAINYSRYGGRGIKVCKRWHDFPSFVSDMGDRPEGASIDRIDNDGDYEPSNCRWATAKEQGRNTSVNRIIEIDGVAKPLAEWCEEFGMVYHKVWARLNLGWTPLAALTTPIRTIKRRRSDDDLCTQTNHPTNGNESATVARSAT